MRETSRMGGGRIVFAAVVVACTLIGTMWLAGLSAFEGHCRRRRPRRSSRRGGRTSGSSP